MSGQLSLFDALHKPPVRRPVDPDGPVVQGKPDEVHRLPHRRLAWALAEIELHRHEDGLWMWSASWHADNAGGSYRVGEKWGRFAESRDDALYHAVGEIRDGIGRRDSADARKILEWAEGLI